MCRERWTRGYCNTFSSHEIREAKRQVVLVTQQIAFAAKKETLLRGMPVSMKSSLAKLDPFSDEFGLIRIGGRLSQTAMKSSAKHPIASNNDSLATKLIRHSHLLAGHEGLTLTLSVLREEHWIIRAKSRTKYVIRTCVTCVLTQFYVRK